ncbi:hypothetical protein DXT99_21420 [Pontibacter diazotrophicus]|uniref:Uncharacterized protein n=1 Tax=Pontibacter diazotrophicus TaxID=1400979 RepID=A0A3D8L6P7_9BACT|nr:hypothetical protein DXT99_21420 [Pontibacter diazotrophicus]
MGRLADSWLFISVALLEDTENAFSVQEKFWQNNAMLTKQLQLELVLIIAKLNSDALKFLFV